MSNELVQLGAVVVTVACVVTGLRLLRKGLTRRIEATDDPMTWSHFEAEHGEASFKADWYKGQHDAFLQDSVPIDHGEVSDEEYVRNKILAPLQIDPEVAIVNKHIEEESR